MSLLLALLAQVGPFPSLDLPPASPLPKEDQQREAMQRQREAQERLPTPPSAEGDDTLSAAQAPAVTPPPAAGAPEKTKLGACLAMIEEDPEAAGRVAQDWLKQAKGPERVEAGQCLGSALAAQEEFDGARKAFIDARDANPADSHASRARLGAMAGNAALAGNDPTGALALLDIARTDAGAAHEQKLASQIATDRARALVALKRDPEAAAALADSRAGDPTNAEAWLLSATLSRRMNKLADAQAQIEQAAQLLPVDPEIGLEAGVIAVLSGHDEAARKSWDAVVRMAPQSDAAATANAYLAQLAQLGPRAVPQPEASR